jgi:hypothetical protein
VDAENQIIDGATSVMSYSLKSDKEKEYKKSDINEEFKCYDGKLELTSLKSLGEDYRLVRDPDKPMQLELGSPSTSSPSPSTSSPSPSTSSPSPSIPIDKSLAEKEDEKKPKKALNPATLTERRLRDYDWKFDVGNRICRSAKSIWSFFVEAEIFPGPQPGGPGRK